MKKCLFCILCLLCLCAFAGAEETPEEKPEETPEEKQVQYLATSHREFSLFSAVEDGKRLIKVPPEKDLRILEYGEEWCLAEYESVTGYCTTKHLYRFRSQQPGVCLVPGQRMMTGFISFNDEVFISGDKFKGLTTRPGQLACVAEVRDDGYVLPVWRGEMTVSTAQATYYPFVNWQDAQPGDVIGGFTTFYGDQQGKGKASQREHNIITGCERIHNTVWQPGDVFSFNELCGPYKKNNGYQYAPNISADGFGYGGGVCQVTTTLYNAVLTLPLQILDLAEHRYIGVVYVPQFFDAAVGSYTDFVFQNTLTYPIRILAVSQEGMLTVLICRE